MKQAPEVGATDYPQTYNKINMSSTNLKSDRDEASIIVA